MMAKNSVQMKILSSPTDNLKKLRQQMPGSGDQRAVVRLAGEAKALIAARTVRGISSSGAPFSPYKTGKTYYAPVARRPPGYPMPTGGRTTHLTTGKPLKTVAYGGGYGQYKQGIGRGAKVQLNVSGQMLGAIAIASSSPTLAILFFTSREEAAKAHGHEFGTTVPRRPFFGIDDIQSVEALRKELAGYMRQIARAAKLELDRRGL